MEAVLARHSCRRYIREPVPREDMERILEAARNYPCADGVQNVEFTVCNNTEKLDALSEKIYQGVPDFHGFLDKRRTDDHVTNVIWGDAATVVFMTFTGENYNVCAPINAGAAAFSLIASAVELGYSTLPVLMVAAPASVPYTASFLGVSEDRVALSVAIGKARPDWAPHSRTIVSSVKWIE